MLSSLLAGNEPRLPSVVDEEVALPQRRLAFGPVVLAATAVLSGLAGAAVALCAVNNADHQTHPAHNVPVEAVTVDAVLPRERPVPFSAAASAVTTQLTEEHSNAHNEQASMDAVALAAPAIGLTVIEKYLAFWRGCAFWVVLVGRVILLNVFLKPPTASTLKMYQGIANAFGFPYPNFLGFGAFVTCLVGPVLIILGPLTGSSKASAWMSVIGAKLLIIFLLVASYFGHYKPQSSGSPSQQTGHKQQFSKNVAIIGGLIMVIGHELPALEL